MTAPFDPRSPAQRNPVPIFEGSFDVNFAIPATPTQLLERPRVGTAWNLEGMSITIVPSVVPGAPGPKGAVVRLLIGRTVVDEFDFPNAAVGARQSLFHTLQPGFTIFDTESVELNVGFDAGAGNFVSHVEFRGNVAYL